MDTFGLKIISSDRVFYEGRCRKMIVPVPDGGGMEILPHHENMVIAVVIGEAMLQFEEGEWVNLAVGAGFLEIVNNRVTMLVQTAEKPEDIDARLAQEQMEYAEEKLRQKQSIQEYYRTQASLSRAMNRLKETNLCKSAHSTTDCAHFQYGIFDKIYWEKWYNLLQNKSSDTG